MTLGFPGETMAIFALAVAGMVVVDLRLHRDGRDISLKDATLWSLFWVALAMGFGAYLRHRHGPEYASLFFAGYALEKTLSVDNLVAFMAVFSYFKISGPLQHRILYFGIVGAVLFRLIFVAFGGVLMLLGGYADLIFGAFVAWSAFQMLSSGDDDNGESEDYSNHSGIRWLSRVYEIVPFAMGNRFIVTRAEADEEAIRRKVTFAGKGNRFATPALACLAVIELSDVMFSFDSVPTVIAVTREPVLVYSAMIFAILGLRSLYFVLQALTKYLVHLEKAVVGLLFFIAAKLAVHGVNEVFHQDIWEPTPTQSLGVVAAFLAGGVVASLLWPSRDAASETTPS